MHIQPESRPTTAAEQHFYETMSAHYQERAAALPGNTFIRKNARILKRIAQEKKIGTIADADQLLGSCHPQKTSVQPSAIRPRERRSNWSVSKPHS